MTRDLWQDLLRLVRLKRMSLDDFRRRHRFDRSFLERLKTQPTNVSAHAAAKLQWLVQFGPKLRSDRERLGLSLRDVWRSTGVSIARLSRAERLLGDLKPQEKKLISRRLRQAEKQFDEQQLVLHRRRAAWCLRKARTAAGLSQERLASLIGRERKAIIRWEDTGAIPRSGRDLLDVHLPGWFAN